MGSHWLTWEGQSPLQRMYTSRERAIDDTLNPDYLLLTNGKDDNAERLDRRRVGPGVDNNADSFIDNLGVTLASGKVLISEWESETWLRKPESGDQYSINRTRSGAGPYQALTPARHHCLVVSSSTPADQRFKSIR